jgi:hypothetical protein
MAKYLLSETTARFFGSLQGSTFQRCGNVFGIRSRKAPLQKKTVSQSVSKNRFESVQSSWRELDSTQQGSFNSRTDQFIRVDSLGNPYELNGQQLHSSSNNNLEVAQQPRINTMADAVTYPSFLNELIALNYSLSAFDIVPLPSIVPANFSARFEVTRPLEAGLIPSQNDYFLLGDLGPGADTTLRNWFLEYVQLFGESSLFVGLRIWCRLSLISTVNGQSQTTSIDFGFVEG